MGELSSTANVVTLYSYETTHSADSVEWCPHEPHQNKFVCANYQLVEKSPDDCSTPQRIGLIYLFCVEAEDVEGLRLLQTVETSGVLDQKWCHRLVDGQALLAAVDSDNQLQLWRLDRSQLQRVTSATGDQPDAMLLSLDWDTARPHSHAPRILVSDSKGYIHLFRYSNESLEKELSVKGHDFEAWICAFYYWDTNIFFTGGDDSRLVQWDARCGQEAVWRSAAHGAGVTCAHSDARREHVLASGSYDQFLLLWDLRQTRAPQRSLQLPGPMWRLKWAPAGPEPLLLAACMLGGVHVVSADDQADPDIRASFYGHGSIAYGADWSYMPPDAVQQFPARGNHIIASCSFYDHKLCVSKIDLIPDDTE